MCKVFNSVIRQDIGAKLKHIDAVLIFLFFIKTKYYKRRCFLPRNGEMDKLYHAEGKLTSIDTAV